MNLTDAALAFAKKVMPVLAASLDATRFTIYGAIAKYIPHDWSEQHAERLRPVRDDGLIHFERLIREVAQ